MVFASGANAACTNLYDGLLLAGSDASVVGIDSCILDGATQRALEAHGEAPLPDGWLMLGSAYDPTDPDNNGFSTATTRQEQILDRAKVPDYFVDGFGFGVPLLLARVIHQMGDPDLRHSIIRG